MIFILMVSFFELFGLPSLMRKLCLVSITLREKSGLLFDAFLFIANASADLGLGAKLSGGKLFHFPVLLLRSKAFNFKRKRRPWFRSRPARTLALSVLLVLLFQFASACTDLGLGAQL